VVDSADLIQLAGALQIQLKRLSTRNPLGGKLNGFFVC
jgi:hypothetical protein